MTDSEITTVKNQNAKVLALGTLIGALVGLGAAYLLLQNTEEEGLNMTPGEGVKLGISVFSFLRQVTSLGK
jgi:glucokinase